MRHDKPWLFSALACSALLLADVCSAQWVNRYARLADFGHHVYLEQHELPILAHGPTDPAPAPDGKTRASAAADLIRAIDASASEARAAYGDVPMVRLHNRFDEARGVLRTMLAEQAE